MATNELEIEKLLPNVDIRAIREYWMHERPVKFDASKIAAMVYDDLINNPGAAEGEAAEVILVLAFEVEKLQQTIKYIMDGLEIVHERTGNTMTMAKVLYGVKHGSTNPAE